MGSDRQIIADQILKAIDYGNLPKNEIERRLEQIIETELNVPFGTEINKEKVDLCTSLLKRFYLQDKIQDKDDIEESKEKVRKRVSSYRRRRSILWTAVRSIAAALILVVGLTLLNVIPPIRWFTGTSTDDEQQYIVQGHVINAQTIASAIDEHEGSAAFVAGSEELVNNYLGFDINLPKTLIGDYQAQTYYVSISPDHIDIICDYAYMNTQGKETKIKVIKTFFTDIDNISIPFEQDEEGRIIQIHDLRVYKYTNVDHTSLLWINGSTMYNVITDNQITVPNTMLVELNQKGY